MFSTSFQRIRIASLFCLLASLPAFSDSRVRIVRLSYVEGSVKIARDAAPGFDKALVNLPVAQGAKLRSADGGRAEVEFEDGTTVRLTPNSAVEFPQLSLRDSGGKVSAVEVELGTVYVDYASEKNEEFSILLRREKLVLTHSAHLRIGVGNSDATVAVFKGDIQIEGPSGTVNVGRGRTASFDFLNSDRLSLARSIDEESYDAWDQQQDQYHLRYASNSYSNYSPYAYGVSDLNYYGNFFNAPGYGMMWQPYFAGVGWDPFMDGAWAFNTGWGYGWVSAYPWGWTPYHYGTWVFLPGQGWAWQPGGVWTTWYAHPRVLNAPKNFSVPQAPAAGKTTVVVNRGPGLTNHSGSRLVIRSNSAGLGVPRGEVKNLARVSQQAQVYGTVTERVHTAPVVSMPAWGTQSEARSDSSSRVSAPARVRAPAPASHSAPPPAPSGRVR
jgi:FecR protein